MTPKVKAKELVDKHHYEICSNCGLSESDSSLLAAKQCASLAVDELIKELGYYQFSAKYWQSVKEEIRNFEAEYLAALNTTQQQDNG